MQLLSACTFYFTYYYSIRVLYRYRRNYICVNSFHWILVVIKIPKNELIIYDSLRKPQENYQQMVNIIQRYIKSILARRIS